MTTYIIISLCVLTLMSYFFDLSAGKTKIPGVILLLVLGMGLRFVSGLLQIEIPNLHPALPILGTLGLILIVLEGSLDLDLHKEKIPLIARTFLSAVVLLMVSSFGIAWFFSYLFVLPFHTALVNAIPLGIISSSIAISSAYRLNANIKEFVVYESSFSDIAGILFFNFITQNDNFGFSTMTGFVFQIVLIIVLAFISSGVLGALLQRITHHVKFIPMITLLVLLYLLAKKLHLPSLILVLIFGLFLNNINLLDSVIRKNIRIKKFIHPGAVMDELPQFKRIVAEVTFIIRSFFFIMFGYYTDLKELIDMKTLVLSIVIVSFFFLARIIYFSATKLPFDPVVFIAPRGLITILLFLSFPQSFAVSEVNQGLLSQIIFISTFILMFGLLRHTPEADKE